MAVNPIHPNATAPGMQHWRAARKYSSKTHVPACVHGTISARSLLRSEWLSQYSRHGTTQVLALLWCPASEII